MGAPGAYRLAQALLRSFRCPPLCRRCWQHALTGCRSEEKRLLQTAAVIGTEVSLPLVAHQCRVAGRRGAARPGPPASGGVSLGARLVSEAEYTFAHA